MKSRLDEVRGGFFNHRSSAAASGGKYVGEFKDDLFNGQGTFTFANGDGVDVVRVGFELVARRKHDKV